MKIVINNRVWVIKEACPSNCASECVRGWCDTARRLIYVDLELLPEDLREVLWHEILHACYWDFKFPERASEEQTVTRVAMAIESFISGNTAFVRKYLLP